MPPLTACRGPNENDTSDVSLDRANAIDQARNDWDAIEEAWHNITAMEDRFPPSYAQYLSNLSDQRLGGKIRKNLNLLACISNAKGVVELHRFRNKLNISRIKHKKEKSEKEARDAGAPLDSPVPWKFSHPPTQGRDAAPVPQELDPELKTLLVEAQRQFDLAISLEGSGSQQLAIARSNKSAALGCEFEMLMSLVGEASPAELSAFEAAAKTLYTGGISLLEEALDIYRKNSIDAEQTRSVCQNNLAYWHCLSAEMLVKTAEVRHIWPYPVRFENDRIELTTLIKKARAAIDDAQAAINVASAAYITDIQLLSLEAKVIVDLQLPLLNDKCYRQNMINQLFHSLTASRARNAKELSNLNRYSVATNLNRLDDDEESALFVDFRPLRRMVVLDIDEADPDKEMSLQREELVNRLEWCMATDWNRKV